MPLSPALGTPRQSPGIPGMPHSTIPCGHLVTHVTQHSAVAALTPKYPWHPAWHHSLPRRDPDAVWHQHRKPPTQGCPRTAQPLAQPQRKLQHGTARPPAYPPPPRHVPLSLLPPWKRTARGGYPVWHVPGSHCQPGPTPGCRRGCSDVLCPVSWCQGRATEQIWVAAARPQRRVSGVPSTLLGATCRMLPWLPARRRCRARRCQRREILGANPTGWETSGTAVVSGACGVPGAGGTAALRPEESPVAAPDDVRGCSQCQPPRGCVAVPQLGTARDPRRVLSVGCPVALGCGGTPHNLTGRALSLSHWAVERCRGHAAAGTSDREKPQRLPEGCVGPGWHRSQGIRGDAGLRARGPRCCHFPAVRPCPAVP